MTHHKRRCSDKSVFCFRCQLTDLFFADLRPVRVLTILTHLIAGISFFAISDSQGRADFAYLTSVLPQWVWGMLFLAVATSRFVGNFLWQGPRYMKLATPILSIWLWTMVFFGSSVFQPNEGLSYLYLISIVVEFWCLAQYLTEHPFRSRK